MDMLVVNPQTSPPRRCHTHTPVHPAIVRQIHSPRAQSTQCTLMGQKRKHANSCHRFCDCYDRDCYYCCWCHRYCCCHHYTASVAVIAYAAAATASDPNITAMVVAASIDASTTTTSTGWVTASMYNATDTASG